MANLILWNCLNIGHAPIRASGPHQLAGWLTLQGYTVKVIDFCHMLSTSDLEEITAKHVDSSTIAVGVSTTFWDKLNGLEMPIKKEFAEPDWVQKGRHRVQIRFPQLKWLLGGANSTSTNLKYSWTVMHGHAEDQLLKFMDEHTSTSLERRIFDIKNLEACFKDDLGIQSSEVLPIELSRGCQFTCKFCRYPLLGKKKNTYLRDFSLIEYELIENYERYGTTRYFFLDDTVNESDEKIIAMAEMAQRLPFKLEWIGYNRLDLIGSKPHTIQLLKDSGLKSSFFGIESFHPQASKIVGKGWNGVKGKDFLIELKERWGDSINFHLGFIVGLTGETSIDLDTTQQWCIDNKMPSWRYYGLGISKSPDLVWKSIFDSSYSDYGYSFPDPADDQGWVNDIWTSQTATEKAISLNIGAQEHSRPAVWYMGELASLGYAFDDLMTLYSKNLNKKLMIEKSKDFIKKYVEFQLK